MRYNYDFEIASWMIMTVILLHFLFIRQFPSSKARIFGILLAACIAESMFNILSCVGLANTTLVPEWVNEALAFAFFVFEGLTSYLIFRYFMVVCELSSRETRIMHLIGGIPCILFSVMVIATPFIGFFYYFEDGSYHQGFGAPFGYFYVAFYFFLDGVMLFVRRSVVDLRTKIIMVMYAAAAIGMIVIQYHVRGLLLTSVSNALIVLMIYLSMQNPREMIDSASGIGNESAFQLQLAHVLSQKDAVHVITIRFARTERIHAALGIGNSNELLHQVGLFLLHLCGTGHVFRIENDTFSVLVPAHESREMQQRIKERFAQEWEVGENRVVLYMDLVIQHYPEDFGTIPEFFGMKQFLFEQAKTAGSSAVVEMDEAMAERYCRRTKVETAMLGAIRERSFEVYYQPIYSVREKSIVSLEALVRLNDAELGHIPPEEFIALAERDGNIVHIGEQVLEEVCRFLAKHVLPNASLGIRSVQVNISMVQCLRKNLSETILPVLKRYHIPPSMITLEITENVAVSTPELLQRHMRELADWGIAFAMDDYGSGNANCSYLIQFPFKEIKIDKEIVWASFRNPTAKMVLENEIRIIHGLGLPLVVEGIEEKEQSDVMERLGVEYIQGYYYGKPMPAAECLRHIRQCNVMPENYAK